ncbi:MAG: putative toxin-antitoxin system toxin component, PIN family [Gemmatimonadetes bacterium]|nr:putative toxin-antitoxin system toxin component, PIN family [Gemmatimonadota bacterium]
MAVRAVLDLNVLIAGVLGIALGRSSPPIIALVAGLEGDYHLLASPRLLDELHTVLQRPRFGLGANLAQRWAELIGSASQLVSTPGRLAILKRDPADNAVLECALHGAAEFLVTGNQRHFQELKSDDSREIVYRGVRVVTPRAFAASALRR